LNKRDHFLGENDGRRNSNQTGEDYNGRMKVSQAAVPQLSRSRNNSSSDPLRLKRADPRADFFGNRQSLKDAARMLKEL
jgi:hypothetical protein